MDFYVTRCPECQTAFRMTPAQLAAADGKVRCGACLTVFNATDNGPEDTIRARMAELDLTADQDEPLFGADNIDRLHRVRDTLELELPPGKSRLLKQLLQAALALMLVVALLLQYLWHNRLILAQDPDRRAWAELLCAMLPCELPPLHDLSAFSGDGLVIRSHPVQPDQLQLTLTVGNTAPFAQPFPSIEVVFRDTDQRQVAERLITPAEYLPDELRTVTVMPANSNIQIQVDLDDPGDEAVNYDVTLAPSF